jgi:phospholipase/lecithinase/hemolysin
MRAPRHTFRPGVSEVLEERVVMSVAAGHLAAAAVHAGAHALPTVANTPVALGPFGILGDSYSDEYRFYADGRAFARNWVDILHTQRLASFGPFTTANRGEPRNQGYAYNWARSGATTTDMIQNQLPGLTAQVSQGDIRYATMLIGGNDFLHFVEGAATGVIPPSQIPAALTQVTTTAISNVETAVGTLLQASPTVKLVVFTIDVTDLPIAHVVGSTPQGQQLLAITGQAVDQFNAAIKQIAASSNRIVLDDLAALIHQVGSNPTGTLNFGGTTISLTTVGTDYHNFFLPDGIHPGTVGQTILADSIVQALDGQFNIQLFPVTPQEGIRYAKMVYGQAIHHGPAKTV